MAYIFSQVAPFDVALLAIVESVRKEDGSPQRKRGKEFRRCRSLALLACAVAPTPSVFRGFFTGELRSGVKGLLPIQHITDDVEQILFVVDEFGIAAFGEPMSPAGLLGNLCRQARIF